MKFTLFLLFKYIPITGLRLFDSLPLSMKHHCLLNTVIESRRHFHDNKAVSIQRNYKKSKIVFFRCSMGGITDRFKAIVSLFDFCDENNLEFKIYSKKPFDFNLFFNPAEYNWSISETEISFAQEKNTALNLWIPSDIGNRHFSWDDEQFVLRTITNSGICSHLFIHASAPYGLPQFGKRFRQLFVCKPLLAENIALWSEKLGREYITVTCRFINLLNDSVEVVDGFRALSSSEKEILISQCIEKIISISNDTSKTVLVTTDSNTFSKKINSINNNRIISIEGDTIHHHIGFIDKIGYSEILKQLTEFFLISQANKAFLLVCGQMYESKFPKWSASLGSVPYTILHF